MGCRSYAWEVKKWKCLNNKHAPVAVLRELFFPQIELHETVICTNEQIQVTIPSVFFLNKDPPVNVCLCLLKLHICILKYMYFERCVHIYNIYIYIFIVYIFISCVRWKWKPCLLPNADFGFAPKWSRVPWSWDWGWLCFHYQDQSYRLWHHHGKYQYLINNFLLMIKHVVFSM